MSDNIKDIGVKFKRPSEEDRMLKVVHNKDCYNHQYLIDAEADIISCSKCNKTFNPMAVLVDLARKESTWINNKKRSMELLKKVEERTSTKCSHCGKMTKIKGLNK